MLRFLQTEAGARRIETAERRCSRGALFLFVHRLVRSSSSLRRNSIVTKEGIIGISSRSVRCTWFLGDFSSSDSPALLPRMLLR